MPKLYKIMDGDKCLGSAMHGSDVGGVVKLLLEGKWPPKYEKHPNAKKVLMTTKELRAMQVFTWPVVK